MGDTLLQERYARVLERLDAACAAAGRSRQSVRLIAVSKLHPAESLAVVAAAGQIFAKIMFRKPCKRGLILPQTRPRQRCARAFAGT